MKRTLFIGFVLLIMSSNTLCINVSSIKAASEGFDEIFKLDKKEAVKVGFLFGLWSFGMGIATKYCWFKTRYWYNRHRLQINVRVLDDQHNHRAQQRSMTLQMPRNIPPAICWGFLTCAFGFSSALFGSASLKCLMKAYHQIFG